MNQIPKPPNAGLLPGGVSLDQVPPEVFASLRRGKPVQAILNLVRRHPMTLIDAKDCIAALAASMQLPPRPPLPAHPQGRPRSRKKS